MARVLVCDDEKISRLKLIKQLEKLKYEIVGQAENGLQAMNMFYETKPDVVLLDIDMPVGSGVTVLSFIREINKECRVVLITGKEHNQKSDFIINVLRKGSSDYLVKGEFDQDRLMKALGYAAPVGSYEELTSLVKLFDINEDKLESNEDRRQPDPGKSVKPDQQIDSAQKNKPVTRMARSMYKERR